MNNKEILEKAIQKAIDGGWITMSDKWELRGNGVYWKGDATEIRQSYSDIIYNHGFAWGIWKNTQTPKHLQDNTPGWQYHLQQMVVAPDPIEYLGEHLND